MPLAVADVGKLKELVRRCHNSSRIANVASMVDQGDRFQERTERGSILRRGVSAFIATDRDRRVADGGLVGRPC